MLISRDEKADRDLGRFRGGSGVRALADGGRDSMSDVTVVVGRRSVGMGSVLRHLGWPASVAFCAGLPVLVLAAVFVTAIQDDVVAMDFPAFFTAAQAVIDGESPYASLDDPFAGNGSYVYPPPTAFLVVPYTVFPADVAGLLAMAVVPLVLLATLVTLGVRDWRCYGLALVWPPVIAATQTASVTIFLAFGAALVWRLRDRLAPCSLGAAVTVATKLILWPLVIWLASTRRAASAVLSCLLTLAIVFGLWAVIGFAGLVEYPELLRRLRETFELDSYTLFVMALDLGASPLLARVVWLAAGVGLLASVVVVGRRGDERTAFVLTIAAALALTPIVWLHYFALLLVAVAIAQPRLGAAWFAPLLMVFATGHGNPAPLQTALTLIAAAVTVGLSVAAIKGIGLRSIVQPQDPAAARLPPETRVPESG